MVVFSPADLPSNVNTVEKLVAWGCMVLNNLTFQDTVQEAPNVLEKVSVSQHFPYLKNGVYAWRLVSRSSVDLSSSFQRGGKLWTHVQEVSTASIPSDFKTN